MTRRLLAAAVLVGLAVGASPSRSADEAPQLPAMFGGPFALVDHTGAARRDSDFRGRHLLVYFGYTYCPDICPTGLQTISDALDMVGDKADAVRPVFISVDPARDTPEVMARYVDAFHPRLIGLTGSEAQVARVAKAYRVHRYKVPDPGAASADDYLVTHSSIAYLMGPDGTFVTLFPHGTPADRMAAVLERYLKRANAAEAAAD